MPVDNTMTPPIYSPKAGEESAVSGGPLTVDEIQKDIALDAAARRPAVGQDTKKPNGASPLRGYGR